MKKEAIGVTTIVEDILCDICGSTVIPSEYRKHADNMDSFSAYGKLTASFGYGSARDGEEFHVDFCEACFNKVLAHVEQLQNI